MPPGVTNFTLLICERALTEKDDAVSAIRLVDIFFVDPDTAIPEERRAVSLTVIVQMSVEVGHTDTHEVALRVKRPNGEESWLAKATTPPPPEPARYPDAPTGFTIKVPFSIVPRAFGTHYVTAALDGQDVASVPFTLVPASGQAK
jgi:hypothetical protein